MTFVDPQTTMLSVLRPADSFETLYQGQAATKPILLVPRDEQNQFDLLAKGARQRPDLNSALVRMVQLGINSTAGLVFPRYWSHGTVQTPAVEGFYQYRVLWRFRQNYDHQVDAPVEHSLADRTSVPDTSGATPQPRLYLPCCQGPLIVPSQIGDDEVPLVAVGVDGVLSQGVYDPDSVANAGSTTYFRPHRLHVEADELGLLVTRVNPLLSSTWDFNGIDAPFANYFGTGGGNHAMYHHLGVRIYHTTSLT